MLKKYQKIIIIVLFAIVLAIAGYFIKQYFDTKNAPADQMGTIPVAGNTTSTTPTNNSQNGEQVTLKKISEKTVFDFFGVSSSSDEIIYVTPAGEIYRAAENEDVQLSKQTFNALNSIAASPSRQKILAAFGDPNQPQWLIFDLIDKAWRPLPNTIKQAIWGADDNELFVISQANAAENLIRLKISQNTFAEEMIWPKFSSQDVNLMFVSPQTLLIAEKPAFFYQGRAWELNLKTNELNLIFGPANGLWLGQTADRSLILKYDNENYLTIISPTQTASYQTWPEKCEGGTEKVYCFMPISWPDQKNWPDDYLQKDFYSEDQLFLFDGAGDQIINLNNNEKIDGLKPTIANNSLYFLNRRDNGLYRLTPLSQVEITPLTR